MTPQNLLPYGHTAKYANSGCYLMKSVHDIVLIYAKNSWEVCITENLLLKGRFSDRYTFLSSSYVKIDQFRHASDLVRVDYIDFLLRIVERQKITKDVWLVRALKEGFSYEDRVKMKDIFLSEVPMVIAEKTTISQSIPGLIKVIEPIKYRPLDPQIKSALSGLGYSSESIDAWAMSVYEESMTVSNAIKSACKFLRRPE